MEDSGAIKKHLLVDTDWITAIVMAGGILVCAFMAGMDLLKVMRGTISPIKITWETWALVVFGLWLFFTTKDRTVRAVAVIITMETIFKIVLWFLHVSAAAQLANAVIFPIINMLVFLSIAVYAAWWLCSKVRRI